MTRGWIVCCPRCLSSPPMPTVKMSFSEAPRFISLGPFPNGILRGRDVGQGHARRRRKPDSQIQQPGRPSLTEYRLTAGFVHAPMSYWGARQIGDIVRLSNSNELEPWDIPGRYSRPICRRIVEDSGVPREAFGTAKRGASVFLLDSPTFLSAPSLADFRTWLENHPEIFGGSYLNRWLGRQWRLDQTLWAALPYDSLIPHAGLDGQTPSLAWRGAWRLRNQGYEIVNRIPTPRHWVFPWALERAAEAYTHTPSTPRRVP
jgi:hypothetical protein